LNRSSHNSW